MVETDTSALALAEQGRQALSVIINPEQRGVSALIARGPEVIDQLMVWSERNPGYARALLVGEVLPNLQEIREKYPIVVSYFSDSKVSELTGVHALISQKIVDEKAELAPFMTGVTISQAEWTVRTLVSVGLDCEELSLVEDAQNLFMDMTDQVYRQVDTNEQENFRRIGQLLETRRRVLGGANRRQKEVALVTQIDPENVDQSFAIRGLKFTELENRIDMCRLLIARLQFEGSASNSAQIKGLEGNISEIREEQRRLCPERFPGHPRAQGHVEIPGGPGFTPAELRDFDRNSSR